MRCAEAIAVPGRRGSPHQRNGLNSRARGPKAPPPLEGTRQLVPRGLAVATVPTWQRGQPAAFGVAIHRLAGGSRRAGMCSSKRSRRPERGCFPRYHRDDGLEPAACEVAISHGAGGLTPQLLWRRETTAFELPCQTTEEDSQHLQGGSWRDTRPFGSLRGGADHGVPPPVRICGAAPGKATERGRCSGLLIRGSPPSPEDPGPAAPWSGTSTAGVEHGLEDHGSGGGVPPDRRGSSSGLANHEVAGATSAPCRRVEAGGHN